MRSSEDAGGDTPLTALDRLADAWAAGDAERYAALFTEDADYVAYDGTRMVGRAAIAAGHVQLFAGFLRGSTMTHTDVVVRDLAPDVALVRATGGIVLRTQPTGARARSSRLSSVTYLLVRGPDGWEFAHFQNTRYRPWDKTLAGRVITGLARRPGGEVAATG